MRFELFLTELPKASTGKVQASLAELPKGASTGTILKSIEANKVPTVAVAWSEDKRVLNEVMDTLVDLGASCKLVDHGTLAQKLVTFAAEKMGRSRYIEDEDDPASRQYIKMSNGRKGESVPEAMLRHTLTYALQLCIAGVLFAWYLALRLGWEKMLGMPGLALQLSACGTGLLVVYVATSSVRAVQAGRFTVTQIIPQLVLGGCLTIASLFFLGDGLEAQVADGSVRRPPSLPYSGLLTELHKRKLAKEASGHDGEGESGGPAELSAAAGDVEDLDTEEELWCERPVELELACEGGRAWEQALACLARPEFQPPKPRRVPRMRTAPSSEPPRELAANEAPPPVATKIEQPWGVTFGLSTLLALGAMWLLSLLGLLLQVRPRAPRKPSPESVEQGNAPTAPASFPPVEERQLVAANAELDVLRAELSVAKAALAKAEAEAEAKQAVSENPQVATLQRELGLSRGALGAHQAALVELKQHLSEALQDETRLSAELANLRQELSWTIAERDQARGALLEMGGHGIEAELPMNDAHAHQNDGARRQQMDDTEDDSLYSVNRVQEERVVLQKRRR